LGADANAFYELMTNEKKSEEAVAEFLGPGYTQHNPLVPDGARQGWPRCSAR
jgi:predicted SnoaL-like aldol condensation-catalyzing enzyme